MASVIQIWKPGLAPGKYRGPEHLSDRVKLCIGLSQWSTLSDQDIARALDLRCVQYLKLLRYLRKCKEPAVKQCFRFGLPSSASVVCPVQFVCAGCEKIIESVPCMSCSLRAFQEQMGELDDAEEEIDERKLTGPSPTDAEPGSPDKIEVLRMRVEKREHLWHPDDFRDRERCAWNLKLTNLIRLNRG